jgi:hypothetical protein
MQLLVMVKVKHKTRPFPRMAGTGFGGVAMMSSVFPIASRLCSGASSVRGQATRSLGSCTPSRHCPRRQNRI